MFDLHTHSILSDGELLPSELIRRAAAKGNEGVAITDHVDATNVEHVLGSLLKLGELASDYEIEFLIGVEVTHVPPSLIDRVVEAAWKEGAEIVVVHGETIAEPVAEGTNLAALQSEVTILAHPGLMSEEEAQLAADNGVYVELTARRGHCLCNGHIAKLSEEYGFELVLNTDAHSPDDILTPEMAVKIAKGSGAGEEVLNNNRRLFRRLRK